MELFAFLLFLLSQPLLSQQSTPQELFRKNCAGCHGEDARGSAKAPGLAMNQRVAGQSPEQLSAFLAQGNIAGGMPSFSDLSATDRSALAAYLRRLNEGIIVRPPIASHAARKITWGPPQPGDWLTYNGNDSGNRYSPLKEINTANVSSVKLKWIFPIQSFGLETTPLAGDGVLFVTGPNQVFALDALTVTLVPLPAPASFWTPPAGSDDPLVPQPAIAAPINPEKIRRAIRLRMKKNSIRRRTAVAVLH